MADGILGALQTFGVDFPGVEKKRQRDLADAIALNQAQEDTRVKGTMKLRDSNLESAHLEQSKKYDDFQDARFHELKQGGMDDQSAYKQAMHERTSMESQPSLAATTADQVQSEQNLGRLANGGSRRVGETGAMADSTANNYNRILNENNMVHKIPALNAQSDSTTAQSQNELLDAKANAPYVPALARTTAENKMAEQQAMGNQFKTKLRLNDFDAAAQEAELRSKAAIGAYGARHPEESTHFYHTPPVHWMDMLMQQGGIGAVNGQNAVPTTATPTSNGISPATSRKVIGKLPQ